MHAHPEVDGHGTPWAYTSSGHARLEAMEWGSIRVKVHNLKCNALRHAIAKDEAIAKRETIAVSKQNTCSPAEEVCQLERPLIAHGICRATARPVAEYLYHTYTDLHILFTGLVKSTPAISRAIGWPNSPRTAEPTKKSWALLWGLHVTVLTF